MSLGGILWLSGMLSQPCLIHRLLESERLGLEGPLYRLVLTIISENLREKTCVITGDYYSQ